MKHFTPFFMASAMLLGLASMGCSTTVRSLSATSWIAPAGGAAAAAAPAAEGQPAAAAPAAAGSIQSQYYVTYWEGKCKPILGCGRGDTHVKRCKVGGDNAITCVEEAAATKALNPAD